MFHSLFILFITGHHPASLSSTLQIPDNNNDNYKIPLTALLSRQEPGFKPQPGASAYQRIISNSTYAHNDQGDNPGQKKGLDGVLYKLWPLLTPWSAASMLLAAPCEPKQIDLAGHWLAQHIALDKAKPDSRPCLATACYKYLTSCSFPTNPTFPALTHTSAHTHQFPSSPWASALDHYMVSSLRSRSWTSARNKERKKKDTMKWQ